MNRIEQILSFWFGELGSDGLPLEDRGKFWFRSDHETDERCREFEQDLRNAASGKLTDWGQQPEGRLALILLLDQFSRNIYRGTPQAFAQDPLALSLTSEGIGRGHDLMLRPIERVFFYMPLEHAESLEAQERCVAAHRALLQAAPPASTPRLRSFLNHAINHRDIIKRFGRFPHRNKLLNRTSTPEELQYLRTNKSTFGQR